MNGRARSSLRGYVAGHGLDVVDLVDFSRLMKEPFNAFLGRHFTAAELTAAGDGVTRTERLASRFAIKEAVMKALGAGWGDGIAFTDVEVISRDTGEPAVILHRQLAELQRARAITTWLVSASHTRSVVVASVIALSS
jgi:holo-[acyl-carrier protein] synthase